MLTPISGELIESSRFGELKHVCGKRTFLFRTRELFRWETKHVVLGLQLFFLGGQLKIRFVWKTLPRINSLEHENEAT